MHRRSRNRELKGTGRLQICEAGVAKGEQSCTINYSDKHVAAYKLLAWNMERASDGCRMAEHGNSPQLGLWSKWPTFLLCVPVNIKEHLGWNTDKSRCVQALCEKLNWEDSLALRKCRLGKSFLLLNLTIVRARSLCPHESAVSMRESIDDRGEACVWKKWPAEPGF